MYNMVKNVFLSLPVLSTDDGNSTAPEITKEALGFCGVNYCPKVDDEEKDVDKDVEEAVDKNFETDQTRFYILASVFLVFSILSGVIVAIFVDPLSRWDEPGYTVIVCLGIWGVVKVELG